MSLFCLLYSFTLSAQVNKLPRSTPEAEGIPSQAVTALFDSLMSLPKTEIHSVMVLRYGKVVAEIYPAPFAPEYSHTMYSCSKTFVSAAVGLAVADNRLRLTDRVATFFPESLPDTISTNLAAMTVRDLLTMTSGIAADWNMRNICTDWIRTFLAKPVREPGKQFEYDSIATYLLSAIVQKVTGMTLLGYLKLKLFNPMNIMEVAWEISPEGYNTGGWGLYIQSESLAKFGQLLLNRGMWKGRQLLPASWVEQMMTKQMSTLGDDYGYQMWLCEYPGAVRADGALGQYILIIPDKDMVVVITECTRTNGRAQRRLVWNRLLPEVTDTPLKVGKAYGQLQKKQQSCRLPFVQGKTISPEAQIYNGKRITLEQNKFGWQSLTLNFKPREVVMTVTEMNDNTYDLLFGYKQWQMAVIKAYPPYSIIPKGRFCGIEGPFRVAGSYAWPASKTLELKVHYVNWVSALDLVFHFDGKNVALTVQENYSSGTGMVIKGKVCD